MDKINSIPALGKESFSCPNCKAFAHQTWYNAGALQCEKENPPWIPADNAVEIIEKGADKNFDQANLIAYIRKRLTKRPFFDKNDKWNTHRPLHNISYSECFSCGEFSVWLYDRLIYPSTELDIEIHPDAPDSVRPFLEEARNVFARSPRAAAAMLRLALQKLCIELGGLGKNINEDIGSLVKKGLDAKIVKALDVVRIVGNNAVHPGEISFDDDGETVLKLFKLIDFTITAMISQPREIEELFGQLPDGAREAIERRDKQAQD